MLVYMIMVNSVAEEVSYWKMGEELNLAKLKWFSITQIMVSYNFGDVPAPLQPPMNNAHY